MDPEGHKFQDLEETGEALVAYINSSQPESLMKVREELQLLSDRHTETKKIVDKLLKGMAQEEEGVAETLLDMEREKRQREEEILSLDEQLRRLTAKSQTTDSEIEFLQRELEKLRSTEEELQILENEANEDTTEVIPAAIYVSQLFYLVSKIKWEFDTEPHMLRGVHYGSELASPISINTSVQSPKDVSDQLWSLIGDK